VAFRQSEVYINRLLIAAELSPVTVFDYAEGPCNETDPDHGNVNVDVTLPGIFTAPEVTAMLHKIGTAMSQLGYGTPSYDENAGPTPDEVDVSIGTYSVLLNDYHGTMGFAVQTCYSTPAPSGSADDMQPITVSPAATSVSTAP
jgi:hypothetical protein